MPDQKLRLDVGCGRKKRPGFFGVDVVDGPEVDLVADLERPLPFEDGTVAEIHCRSVIEHIEDPVAFMDEMHRLLRPGGQMNIFVPHFSNPYTHSDPTHKGLWGLYSFDYLVPAEEQTKRRKVPDHYTERRWRIVEQRLYFRGETGWGNLLARAFGKLVNRSTLAQERYERVLPWLVPCYAVVATLTPAGAPQALVASRAA